VSGLFVAMGRIGMTPLLLIDNMYRKYQEKKKDESTLHTLVSAVHEMVRTSLMIPS
jgi:hypothetical protein